MNQMMKQLLSATLLVMATTAPVWAHGGGAAKHGGIVQTEHDLSFELVATDGGAALYVEDHGQPVASEGLSGKLTVLSAEGSQEAALVPGAGRLEATGVTLTPGAKVVATVAHDDHPITVRFTVK